LLIDLFIGSLNFMHLLLNGCVISFHSKYEDTFKQYSNIDIIFLIMKTRFV